ncbi:hypothetical protein LTR97_007164 [Elasticomyces elasticus]|uniref:Uncharacterized protein n=1 Tax=Elasticomyces elasticus TaxID=574655 RepID=A0AAN7W620_9PEZI|nr:hypothetical protein LTR97_007164 [Elasticomyces elasticus]
MDCDIRVTAGEFARLSKERVSLLAQVDEAYRATVAAQQEVIEAQDRLSQSLAKEVIAVEERGIEEQEAEEFMAELDLPSFEPHPWDDRLMMSPAGWASFGQVPEVSGLRAEPIVPGGWEMNLFDFEFIVFLGFEVERCLQRNLGVRGF